MSRLGGVLAVVLGLGVTFASCSPRFKIPTMHGVGGDASGGAPESHAGDTGESSDTGGSGTEQLPGVAGAAAGERPTSEANALTIVSIKPNDRDSDVERDAPVQVTFSRDIDPKTITSSSFRVEGPAGVVSGKLKIEDATVTFVADAPWSLLADYNVKLAGTIAAADATPIDEAHVAVFQTRDGVFGKPERLSSAKTVNLGFTSNRAGHAAVYWQTNEMPSSVQAVLYDPTAGKWGPVADLDSDDAQAYDSPRLALNGTGRAFATFSGPAGALAWNRFDGVKWGNAKRDSVRRPGACVLAEDGTALTMWEDVVVNTWTVFAAQLSLEDKWSPTTTLATKARPWLLAHYGSGYLALFSHEPDGQVFYRVLDVNGVWAAERPLTPTGSGANYVSLDTFGDEALFTWNDPKGRMRASVFDGTVWEPEDLGPVAGGTNARIGSTASLASWIYQKNAYAAFVHPDGGWADPVKLGPTTAEFPGPASQVDVAGNWLVAWQDGGAVSWRRLPHSAASWAEPQQIKDQDPTYVNSAIDASGNVMLVWSNALGVWASRFD